MNKNEKILTISVIISIMIVLSTPSVIAQSESDVIPSWVKGVANFWVEGNITDSEFIEAIKFLIESEIIVIDGYEKMINTKNSIELQVMILTVITDKETYQTNEPIIISGTVPNNNSGTVTIIIINSSGNIMTITQVSSTSSGTYTKTILTENSSGLSNGMYKVQVQYDSEKIETSFSLN